MNNPEISIIAPVYNAEKYLPQCLDSILNQTFNDWELLLIDDGSADNSPAISDEYAEKDSRIRVIHQANAGASAARNAGLDSAQGKWITFVDSDDWIAPDYLDKLLQTARNQNADVVFCNCYFVQGSEIIPQHIYTEKQVFDREEIFKKILVLSKIRSELWGKIYKRELLASVRLKTSVRIGEDMLFLIELYYSNQSFKTAIITDFLYYYRQLDSSVMRTGNLVQNIKQTTQEYEKFIHHYPDVVEKYLVENATFIVRLLTYISKQDVLTQFKDRHAMKLLKENFEKAKVNLVPNEIRFIRLLFIHPWIAKIGFEMNNLKRLFKKKNDK